MKELLVSDGSTVQVDDIDFLFLLVYSWSPNGNGYHVGWYKGKLICLHRLIGLRMGFNCKLDHIDRNRNNDQRNNLRQATSGQNNINIGLRSDNQSGYKGVYWRTDTSRWTAQLQYKGRTICLGCFDSAIKAAEAYDYAARKCHKEFAFLNFPGSK